MSARAIAWARTQGGLTPTQKLLLIQLSDDSDARGVIAELDIDRISAEGEHTHRHTRRLLTELQERGLLDPEGLPWEGVQLHLPPQALPAAAAIRPLRLEQPG